MKSLKFTLALTLSLTALLVPMSVLATNILTNSGLNDPYLDIPGRTWNGQNEKIASGWQPFFIAAGTQDANLNAKKLHWMSSVQFALSFGGVDYHIEGNRSQNMWSSYKFDAGIYQQITGLTPGQGYGFDIPIVTYWRGPGYPDSNGKMVKLVGIDPAGGTDPTSPNVVWSAADSNDKAWVYMDVAVTAQASTITVFAKVQAPENDSVNHTDLDMVYFDAAHVAPVPTTTLTATPSGTMVNLSWSGSGVAPSSWSLKGYEVQYREAGASNWTTLQGKSSTNTSGSFSGQAGHVYVVRARTWQKINESYQSDIDMPGAWREQTVTVGALVSGRVSDNRGNGISGVVITESGTGATATSGSDGLFTLGMASSGQYTFTASPRGGWTAPPPVVASVQMNQTTYLIFVLRPPDDVVNNGDFESGLNNWQVSGASPNSVTNGQYSGSASLWLSGTTTLSQTDSVANSFEPVLSFWYKMEGGNGTDVFTAELLGTDGLTPVNSFTTSTNGGWQHVSLPLNLTEVYTGPIGVRFDLVQSGAAALYLDEVSLGASWGGSLKTYLPVIVQ